jgi:hypothetical protein
VPTIQQDVEHRCIRSRHQDTPKKVPAASGVPARRLVSAGPIQPATNPRFVAAALDNLHYLLGRNTFSLSWVTQVGENPYHHPHHRPSAGLGLPEPWPGLLSGGPNRGRQDAAMRKLPNGPPAKMYLDEQASYASNEVAIKLECAAGVRAGGRAGGELRGKAGPPRFL